MASIILSPGKIAGILIVLMLIKLTLSYSDNHWSRPLLMAGVLYFGFAMWSSFEVWSLYNGLIAYLLMGTLLGGEYIVRMKTQKHVR